MKIKLLVFAVITHATISAQTISTIGGTGSSLYSGSGIPAIAAGIPDPIGGYFDSIGNYFFADGINSNRVRKIGIDGIIETIVGNGTGGFSGDGTSAGSATINFPQAITMDTSGNIFIADHGNYRIRKVDAISGIITTYAGTGTSGFFGDGGPAISAKITGAEDICLDKFGNLYIADQFNFRIRKVTPSGIISTFAGNGSAGSSGDGGPATFAMLWLPYGLASDDTGNIYIADRTANVVRKVNTSGIISTIAGNGSPSYIGDGIAATSAQIVPNKIAINPQGLLFIADDYNERVYMVDNAGILHSVVGNGTAGFSGDGGLASSASINMPSGLAFNKCGNLFIADVNNRRVRKVTFSTTGASPVISITASPHDTVCAGTPVTYTASVSGAAPTGYQWYVNGALTGTTSATYTYTPANHDTIRATFTGNEVCNGTTVWGNSNSVHMVVLPVLVPTITITSVTTAVVGSIVTITAAVSGAGSSYNIRWFNHGVQFAATTVPTVSYTKGTAIDTITARIISASPGCYDSVLSNVQIIRPTVGVASVNAAAAIDVFPNPAGATLFIQGSALQGYRIISPVGTLMHQGVLKPGSNTVSLLQLPPGAYLLQVQDEEEKRTITRLIKR